MSRTLHTRLLFLLATIITIPIGLSSRKYPASWPELIQPYAGDVLWATMFYFIASTLFPRLSMLQRGLAALGFAFLIELSQLYHAPWFVAIRSSWLGHMVLGEGWLWSDLICYSFGVLLGMGLEELVLAVMRKSNVQAI